MHRSILRTRSFLLSALLLTTCTYTLACEPTEAAPDADSGGAGGTGGAAETGGTGGVAETGGAGGADETGLDPEAYDQEGPLEPVEFDLVGAEAQGQRERVFVISPEVDAVIA